MRIEKCRICKSDKLKMIFSLGDQPLANKFYDPETDPETIKKYPLELMQCDNCTLLQLSYVVPKEEMYDEYFYIPSVSKTNLRHFEEITDKAIAKLQLKKGSLIIDIGSNDGSLLDCFKRRGMNVLGIEPANNIISKVVKISNYFSYETAEEVVHFRGRAKLITATNVFAHIDNLDDFLKGLDVLLDDDGVFFAQFPDVRNLLKENQFDTIYHEHLSYFTYEPLHFLFAKSKFELFDITSDNIHGGSMQIWVRRRLNLFEDFVKDVGIIKEDLYSYLSSQKKKGKKIVGFGAAAKGTVLLNYCGLDNKIIDYVIDGTPYKQRKLIPGANIPILPEEKLLEDSPDIVLILAWNFKEEIMEKLKGLGYTFVVPIPKVQIYENSSSR